MGGDRRRREKRERGVMAKLHVKLPREREREISLRLKTAHNNMPTPSAHSGFPYTHMCVREKKRKIAKRKKKERHSLILFGKLCQARSDGSGVEFANPN